MYRSCRAGRNVWQQLVSCANRPLPGVTTTTTNANTIQATRTTITPGTTQIRHFASGTNADGAPPVDPSLQPSRNAADALSSSSAAAASSPSCEDGPKVVFSGIQPTGVPHLGNYLGALREWKRLQDTAHPETKLFFCIVDMHAITVPRPREELYDNRRQMLAALLAMGLDPDRSTIFFQSSVEAHTELQWILSCTASVGYLSRMTQWKSKMQLGDNASLDDPEARKSLKHGLFSYPILQAADILIHRATHVPVGEDQRQHLEFARECVTNFNHTYKTDCLVAPQTLVSPSRRIMSLSNPLQKMSKSDPAPKSRILITDTPEEITKKINHAVTDSDNAVTYAPQARPGVANLIEILSAFDPKGRTPAQLGEEMQGHKIRELKELVGRAVCDELAEVRERYISYKQNTKDVMSSLDESTARARASARNTMDSVKQAMGLEA